MTGRLFAAMAVATAMLMTASAGAFAGGSASKSLAAPTGVQLAAQLDCADGPCQADDGTFGVIAVFRDNATGEDGFEYEIKSRVAGTFLVPGLPARGSGGYVASIPYPGVPGDRFCVRIRATAGDDRGEPSERVCRKLTREGVLLPA
jgi:hypothetical protein